MKKLLFLVILSSSIFAQVKISKLDYKTENNFGVLTINYTGELKTTPELMIKDDIVQISIPQSMVWPKIENKVTINNAHDSTIMAYQYTKDLVRVRAALPYKLNGKENKVSIVMGDSSLSLYFPKIQTASAKKNVGNVLNKIVAKEASETNTENAENYDESYLNKLLKDKEKTNTALEVQEANLNNEVTKKTAQIEDTVTTNASAVEKSSFSMGSYVVKFVGFFALLIAGMYFVMNFFRKGVLRKSGLGFFSSEKMIEVMSTTYIAPKRNLMVVRVGKQLFLVAQSEKGMDYLTEIKDTAAFIKESEKEILGSNFDTNLDQAKVAEKEFKLKDMITTVEDKVEFRKPTVSALKAPATSEKVEKSTFSKQIKSKLKDLKQFQ